VWLNISDVRDAAGMDHLVRDKDYVFHLAAQVSHMRSLTDPFPDIDINIKGTAVVLEACKAHNRRAIVVRAGTRGQYGPATTLPVSEDAPMHPKGLYEISQLAAEQTLQVYHDNFGIRSVNLRLTNVYGPRAQMRSSDFGVANWFIRLAIDDETIKVFGDGSIKRDFLYVDDCVDAMIRCAADSGAHGRVFNVGAGECATFKDFAETVVRIAGTGRWEFAPFTAERAAQEPGDFYSVIARIRATVGWEPRTSLADGISRTLAFYRAHKAHYW
jgi:UDP-glucose 4-epimerase